MKKILNTIGLFLAISLGLTSCKEEVRELYRTDIGPNLTVVSCSDAVYMGENIKFSVDVTDDNCALSTLKAQLLFDDTVVAETTIRTKEFGHYEGKVLCPLPAKIPNGTASFKIIAQNVGMGITEQSFDVDVKRPDFPELYLYADDMKVATLKKAEGSYEYAVVGSFPSKLKAYVQTPAINAEGEVIRLGWSGTELELNADNAVPFSLKNAGTYEIKVNLFDLTATPLGKLTLMMSKDDNVVVANLVQGATLDIKGLDFATWNLDYDFFKLEEDNSVTFTAISGLYRLAADFDKQFIRVDMMKNKEDYAEFDPETPHASALYAIGSGFGKPNQAAGADWNTTDGAWCLAQTEENIYQFTLQAGVNCSTESVTVKFFTQRGWDDSYEFDDVDLSVDGKTMFTMSGHDINVAEGVKLETKDNLAYRFCLDFTAGKNHGKIYLQTVKLPAGLDIKVNDVKAKKITNDHYCVTSVELKKGEAISYSVPSEYNLAEFYLDPDYLTADGKFASESGYYAVDFYLGKKFCTFKRVDQDGTHATWQNGGLWLMGWGVAAHKYNEETCEGGELGFSPGLSFSLAQVAPMVFQFTGRAIDVPESESMPEDWNPEIGGRFRSDYISIKYFGQDNWGDEMGKMFGEGSSKVELTDEAAKLIALPGNIELAEGVKLEAGATYVLTIDLSTQGVEKIDFRKK